MKKPRGSATRWFGRAGLAVLMVWLNVPAPAGRRASNSAPVLDTAIRARASESYGRLPLTFEANQGQTDPQVKFLSRGAGYNLFLTATEAVMDFRISLPSQLRRTPSLLEPFRPPEQPQPAKRAVVRMKFAGADSRAVVAGADELPGKVNYFIGNKPKKWRTNVPTYAK